MAGEGSTSAATRARTAAEEAELLLELARTVGGSLDLQEVLDLSLSALRRLLPFGGGAIQMIHGDALVAVATDPPATAEALALRIPVGHGVSGQIATECRAIYIPDITVDARVQWQSPADGVSLGVRSYFGAPLIMNGAAIGVVQIDAPRVDAFDDEARALLLAFLPTIAAAVQNAMLYRREMETVRALQEAEQVKDDFLAIASHELRTPLTALTGFSATLAQQADVLERATIADFAARMHRATEQLERIVSDLLDVARVEHGMLEARLVPTPIEPVVREAVEGFEGPVTVTVEPGLGSALAEPTRLRQVLMNLLSNARRFSPPGTSVEVQMRRRDPNIAIDVVDHGVGIASDKLDRIFDRFFQVDPALTRRAGGLGVGLYLVRRLADLMQARVEVESTPGLGSRFTVLLRPAGP